jgi:hypothetical protein
MPTFYELSDRLDPMTVKELQQGMRRASFVYPFLGIHLLTIAALLVEFSIGEVKNSEYPGIMNLVMLFQSGPFWMVVSVMCIIIMPLGGLMLMGQELEEGNHELLLLTKLNRWAVVRGKFFTLWGICTLSLISLLPYVVVRYHIGGVEMIQEIACALSVLGGSAVVCAGAIAASSFKNIGKRTFVFVTFLLSFFFSAAVVLIPCGGLTLGINEWFFHSLFNISGIIVAVGYSVLGVSIARSTLRTKIQLYDLYAGNTMFYLSFLGPIFVVLTTVMTVGFGGFIGIIVLFLMAIYTDVTPKLKLKTPPLQLQEAKFPPI